ncbi:MAG: ABC transporter substrate-binding protein, partial [Dehalococcoidia bacterium]|nr:ABC transporter substrate-binding protein [Dehalococcoidia bacterium]
DVVFTVQQILDRNWPQRAFLGTAVAARVADTYAVEITTRVPDLSVPNGGPYLYIVPRRYFEANGFEGFRERPMGSGPYELVEFRAGDSMRLRKRAQPHAFRRPVADEVIIRAIPEPAQILNGLRAGEIDIVPFGAFTADQADQMRRAGLNVQSFPLANISFSIIQGYNEARQTPLIDRRVRLALNYAVNREAIASSIYRGFAEPVGQYAIPGSLYWDPSVRPMPFNPAEARRLLAEAGYASGFRVTIDWGPMIAQDVVTAVQGMLRDVGVDAELRFSDQALLQERIFGRNNQSLAEIYAGGTTDQNGFAATVRTTHGCNRPAGVQPSNVWYCNPEWERIWDSALGERDPQRRAQIMREANRIQREDLWVIFGVLQPVYVVSTSRVGDVSVPFIGAYLLDSAVKLRP